MQITQVEVFLLHDRFVYLKVDTDEGIAGWGEAAFHGGRLTAQPDGRGIGAAGSRA